MRVFVTGGNGFIGSRVVRRLNAGGHEVRCLVRPAADTRRIRDLPLDLLVGDMHDHARVRSGLAGCDACIHMASASSWDEVAAPGVEHSVLGGTRAVLGAARAARTPRLLYVSSAAAVNASRRPAVFDEDSPFELSRSGLRYAIAKHEAESLVLAAASSGVEPVVVNPGETYGPGDDEMVTAGAIRDVLTGWPALAVRGGASITHVDDVAAGIVAALEHGRGGQRYILGGENLTIERLVRSVLDLAGLRRPVVVVPPRALAAAVRACVLARVKPPVPPALVGYLGRYWYVDSGKAARELGYRARPAAETLASVVGWLQERPARVPAQVAPA